MMKKIFLSLIFLFIVLFLSACSKQENNSKSSYIPAIISNADSGKVLISLSDSYRIADIVDEGPKILSGSKWIDSKYLKQKNLNKYYIFDFDNKKVLYYDEVNGRRAGFVVFVLRKVLWKQNVSLAFINNKDLISCKECTSLNLTGNLNIDLNSAIGTGKYWIVINPWKIKFNSGDLLLYVSDVGLMKQSKFYQQNKDKVNIANFYWSYIIDINGKLKSKEEILNLLSKNWIDLNQYDKIYFYYPEYRWRAWLIALYFSEKIF